MANRSMNVVGVIALLGMMVGGCASEGTTGFTAVPSAPVQASLSKDINRVASGSVEDSSAACAGRIPQDASAGQKMLAAESCERDRAARR